jgi:hypothetical protein
MELSHFTQKAFDKWIKAKTWHTGHPLDEKRFFHFVWAAFRYSRRRPGQAELAEMIAEEWRGRIAEDFLESKARYYAGLYAVLLDFAKTRP